MLQSVFQSEHLSCLQESGQSFCKQNQKETRADSTTGNNGFNQGKEYWNQSKRILAMHWTHTRSRRSCGQNRVMSVTNRISCET
ncbi:uncharacterized protein LOC105185688 isoform X2 [Harpegnathos saltator]|uniref:uncharacterized protein LOC105185688 isoform X2 n=1 Tax=Harpegnathos saltator TaxID=610380 RepID=UPI000DBED911|nr:uncharacterized protein LOC105185688 isoform X2 [Harpegnathos saltator]